jgi:serine/threonine protein phosphatase PrpC
MNMKNANINLLLASSGSDMVAEHVRKHLPGLIVQQQEFYNGDYETAIAKAFQDEDKLLLELVRVDDTEPIAAGSTVALCLINLTKGVLVVGDVGDSQIMFAERTTSEDVAGLV